MKSINKKKGIAPLALGIMLVSFIIVGVIVDALITDTTNLSGVNNETVGTTNGTGYLAATLSNIPVSAGTETIFCAGTSLLESGNYTLNDVTGALVVDSGPVYCNASTAVYAGYSYEGATYFDNSLSRVVATYIVPLFLLGILLIAAMSIS